MLTGTEIEDAVLDLIRSRAPLAETRELTGDLRLGAGGLGLDSIALVELLLDCERRLGLANVAELLAGPPLTVGLLVAHARAAAGRR
jgi:acyl carrier protein